MDLDPEKERISPQEIAAFVAGDREAFRCIFERLNNEVAWVVRRLVRGAFDQEEAQQEVWLHLHRMRGQVDVNRSGEFVGWVRRVARNRTIDFLKSRSRAAREIPAEEPEKALEQPQHTSQNPEQDAANEGLRRSLKAFVQALDPKQQRFFQLCFVEERSHGEIATTLGIDERRSKYLKKKLLAQVVKDKTLQAYATENAKAGS
ncbi:MAG: sigma-70 family RNA polymerase sigma factor [Deltaproteobacteria bacterium]|nr:sigma-70 family RNA polymerase sigma factor [Deltaproteobacteria bacterium]